MNSTLGDVRDDIAESLGLCASDPKVVSRINSATRRLLPKGKWVGTYQQYRFCVTSGCITLPRQLETIETAAICKWPVTIHSEWGQYVKDGYGLMDGCPLTIEDKGMGFVAFEDVLGTNKKLRVYSDTTEAVDAKIKLEFWNENKLYVRSLVGGTWINGEQVTISPVPTDTVNFCMPGGFVAVQKPITNGNVFIYEHDTVTLVDRLIATYEPDETRPNYRRYVLPALASSSSTETCQSTPVDIIAKRRFIPVINDDDWLVIGHPDALENACIAIDKEKKRLFPEALPYWSMALAILDDELKQFLGDGMATIVQISSPLDSCDAELSSMI